MMATGSRPLFLMAAACALLPAVTCRGQDAPAKAVAPPVARAAPELQRKLSVRVDFEYDAVPLLEFVQQVAARTEVEIRVDEPAIRAAGISLAVHVSANYPKVTIKSALSATLRKYGLRYRLDESALVIEPSPRVPDEAMLLQVREDNEELRDLRAEQLAAARRIATFHAAQQPQAEMAVLQRVGRMQDIVMQQDIVMIQQNPGAARLLFEAVLIELPVADRRRADDDLIAEVPPPAERIIRVRVSAVTFDHWLFDNPSNADKVRAKLDEHLRTRIAAIDRLCRLTDSQKRKLDLAGRGDIHRLLERIEETRAKFERNRDDQVKALALYEEVRPLRLLLDAGPFDGGSLFARILKTTLTPEQAAEYERRRDVR
jgi:hypothetical protein